MKGRGEKPTGEKPTTGEKPIIKPAIKLHSLEYYEKQYEIFRKKSQDHEIVLKPLNDYRKYSGFVAGIEADKSALQKRINKIKEKLEDNTEGKVDEAELQEAINTDKNANYIKQMIATTEVQLQKLKKEQGDIEIEKPENIAVLEELEKQHHEFQTKLAGYGDFLGRAKNTEAGKKAFMFNIKKINTLNELQKQQFEFLENELRLKTELTAEQKDLIMDKHLDAKAFRSLNEISSDCDKTMAKIQEKEEEAEIIITPLRITPFKEKTSSRKIHTLLSERKDTDLKNSDLLISSRETKPIRRSKISSDKSHQKTEFKEKRGDTIEHALSDPLITLDTLISSPSSSPEPVKKPKRSKIASERPSADIMKRSPVREKRIKRTTVIHDKDQVETERGFSDPNLISSTGRIRKTSIRQEKKEEKPTTILLSSGEKPEKPKFERALSQKDRKLTKKHQYPRPLEGIIQTNPINEQQEDVLKASGEKEKLPKPIIIKKEVMKEEKPTGSGITRSYTSQRITYTLNQQKTKSNKVEKPQKEKPDPFSPHKK